MYKSIQEFYRSMNIPNEIAPPKPKKVFKTEFVNSKNYPDECSAIIEKWVFVAGVTVAPYKKKAIKESQ